jgi:hypothetical protein
LQLNLPFYSFKIKEIDGLLCILDTFRRKYVALTPEEWVRQHLLHHLHNQYAYPKHSIAVEKQLKIGTLIKRFDALVYNQYTQPAVLIECKAPDVPITQQTFDQAARYNTVLNAPYLLVSNGLQHFFCRVDRTNQQYVFLENTLHYSEL